MRATEETSPADAPLGGCACVHPVHRKSRLAPNPRKGGLEKKRVHTSIREREGGRSSRLFKGNPLVICSPDRLK
ncbi:hypothetical protein M407DRAFT_245846 [Tulasnella calospora MUT 4182]|uniref:Uncharacterized protein n=1 Tax=Tulasnella calospora MUT 4182 TaxID=1051891 RepID=A0A0C3KFP3_9AGAM|nr:hypothetical protein M407DRAFT_245846 [Tulasnella calospora MUT 4182]